MGRVWDCDSVASASDAELRDLAVRSTRRGQVDPDLAAEISREIRHRNRRTEQGGTTWRSSGSGTGVGGRKTSWKKWL